VKQGELSQDGITTHQRLNKRRIRYWQFSLLLAATLFLSAGLYIQQIQKHTVLTQDALLIQAIVEQGNNASLEISQQFNTIKQATSDIAYQLSQSNLSDNQIRVLIKDKVLATKGAFRGGVVFKKDRFNPAVPLYSPFYQKGANNQPKQALSDKYDYTLADDANSGRPRTFWFHQPLKEGPMWLAPYYGTSAKSWIAEFIRPFSSNYDNKADNGYDGIIFLNLSLSGLSQIVSQLDLAQSGFGFILTVNDELISYPVADYLGQDIHKLKQDDSFFKTILAQREKGPITSFIHPINKKECWLFFSEVSGTKDTLGILVWADELRAEQALSNGLSSLHKLPQLLFLISGILLLSCLKFPHKLINLGYRFSILISCVMFISLINMWADKLNNELSLVTANQVFEKVNVNNFILKHAPDPSLKRPSLSQTEVGFNINAITQLDPGTIQVLGDISLSKLDNEYEEPPVFFPLAIDTQWEKLASKENLQKWKFTSEIRQPFNYASFPFDMEEIKIQIEGKNQIAKHILVPKFSMYQSMNPEDLPGINQNGLELSGWQIKQSYFSYQDLNENLDQKALLSFNLVIKRVITGPVITHLLPLIMVSCLAFCTLLLWTKNEAKITLWGFSSSTVLEQCAALFFILVISHVSLRDELEAKDMIFLEYFYFGTYAQIVFVAVAAILYTSDIQSRILNFKEGLILKMLYWPICFAFCIAITLINLQ